MSRFSIFCAFIGGAVLGAAAGLLFAPETGSETRKKIAEQSNNLKQRIKDGLEERGVHIDSKDLEQISEELEDELL